MFIYFSKNKLNYEKGQLIPVFIVVLVVLIIMGLITVNLGKIGLQKTETSNAADAGALAGGSVMANVFNAQAIANSQLIANYQMFLAEMGTLFATMVAAAYIGAGICAGFGCHHHGHWFCCPSPGCANAAGVVQATIISIWASIVFFQVAQAFTYLAMKREGARGRDGAIEMAYRYAFINSGIGNKLISSSPPEQNQHGDDRNYSDGPNGFNEFIRGSGVLAGDYIWHDGQDRRHQVHVDVRTQDMGTYTIRVTAIPTLLLLFDALDAAWMLQEMLMGACGFCWCSAGVAYAAAGGLVAVSAYIMAGLAPAWSLPHSGLALALFIITWVEDINHDRKFSVTTWETQEKQDYGLWEAKYPQVTSSSRADFRGRGSIYRPDPSFDADIESVY